MALKTAVFLSIDDIPANIWDGVAARHSLTFSHRFWQMLEKSRLPNFAYNYVVVSDAQGNAVAVAAIYAVSTDIAIFSPQWLRTILAGIRRFWPHFLILRMVECGTPVTLNSPPYAGDTHSSGEIIAALHQVMLQKSRKEGQLLLVMRDFGANAAPMQHTCAMLGYHWAESLPNTYLSVRWDSFADYLAAMKSYYRCKVIKHQKRGKNQQFRYVLTDDFAPLADRLCTQWLVVHDQADEFQREVLTPEFYQQFSALFEHESKALLFYQGEELIGHALLLVDGDILRWLYFGREKAVNDSLYLYVGHSIIATGIKLRVKRIEMGLTTYAIKQDMGAEITPIYIAVRTRFDWLNPLVGFFYPLLNHIPHFSQKDVFKG